jgi:hypothetical protein
MLPVACTTPLVFRIKDKCSVLEETLKYMLKFKLKYQATTWSHFNKPTRLLLPCNALCEPS